MPDFKPSEVRMWRSWLPLFNTFGRIEMEWAAALMVIACVYFGDRWQPITMKQLGEAMKDAGDRKEGYLHHLRGPDTAIPRPDHRGLVDKGFAVFDGDPDNNALISFTDKGFEMLRKTVAAKTEQH